MELLFEIHSGLPREAPGRDEDTITALEALDLPSHPSVVDIGCGPGRQALLLAKNTRGNVIGVDTHSAYLKRLSEKAFEEGLGSQISTLNASMFELPLENESIDLIWAEGSIYIIVFENGLRSWRKFLKQDGFLAVTEISWLRADPPQEALAFWSAGYPGMSSTDANIEKVERSGYRMIKSFVLPESAWWDEYYSPLRLRLAMLREKYRDNLEALTQLTEAQREIDLYSAYSQYYGYVFYVMQKQGEEGALKT